MHFAVALLALIAGVLDRLRGAGKAKALMQAGIGWIVALALGHWFDAYTPFIIACFMLGISWGWGTPLFSFIAGDNNPAKHEAAKGQAGNREWWQRGILKTDGFLALTVRGFLIGAPLLALTGITYLLNAETVTGTHYVALAYMLAFPVAAIAGRVTYKYKPESANTVNELTRSSLAVFIIFTV